MKKTFFLTAIVCLLAVSAFAQKKADFSGTWTLDASKSKLDERARIESMTMTVTQTDKDIKVETATKRLPLPEPMNQGGGNGQGGGQGRGMGRGGFGDGTTVYTLDGKESTAEVEGRNGKMPVKLKAELEGSKLNLSRSSSFSTPNGDFTSTTKETWTLSEDGKTLTVKRETESSRGTNSSEMVFTKK
ncbi:MAG TPA: hypothetical protein VGC97_24065 [Pyrinomonadaceae bacterium]|jgi:hypothetical protein